MLLWATFDQNSVIVRVKILDSTATTGAGKTGLTSASTGLIISTIADSEAAATTYTVAASNVETITTLGTYSAPTASKCRFKEVDATNHPGVYELQFADARFSISGSKSLLVSILGATGAAQCDAVIPLPVVDLFNGVRAGLTALPNAAADAAGGLAISDAGGLDLDARLDAAVSSRMATYTQPTGFLAATFPSGTVANTTNITAGTITTATNLTTNNDKTGYTLSAAGVTAVWDEVIDGTRTAVQAMRGFIAALLGKASGLDLNAPKYRNIADTKNVIDATTDASGNRSAVTLDLT